MNNFDFLEYYNNIPPNSLGKSDKGTVHDYISGWYSAEFSEKRYDSLNILEIGAAAGDSMVLFRDYFENSKFTTIDNLSQHDVNKTNQIKSIKGVDLIIDDAYTLECVSRFEDGYFDYIIDDGPHTLESQLYSVEHYLGKVKLGGKLIIEDVKGSYLNTNPFDKFGLDYEIIDLRANKNRYDDILVIFEKK